MNGNELARKLRDQRNSTSSEINSLEKKMNNLVSDETDIKTELSELYGTFSRLRLKNLEADKVTYITRVGADALQLLAERKSKISSTQVQLESTIQTINTLQEKLYEAQKVADESSDELTSAHQAADQQLSGIPEFQDAHRKVMNKQSVYYAAVQKSESATNELSEKRKAFEADKTFMYLWKRGFGTTDYKVKGLFRNLDEWAASTVGFTDARKKFELLHKLQEYLKDKAEKLGEQYLESQLAADQIRSTIEAQCGVPTFLEKLNQHELNVDNIRSELIEYNRTKLKLESFLSSTADKTDDMYAKIQSNHAMLLRCLPLESIEKIALSTESNEDDQLVSKIKTVKHSLTTISGDIKNLVTMIESARAKRARLDTALRKFKSKGYESNSYKFNRFDEGLITGYMLGTISLHSFDSSMSNAATYNPPSSAYSPSSSFGNSSGFSTGGNFGGGSSFSTGGGF